MSGVRRSSWRKGFSIGVLLASLGAIAALPSAASADQRPVDVSIAAFCDTVSSTWRVGYVVHNQTPVTVVFERAVDPTTGAVVPVPTFALESYSTTFLDGATKPGSSTTAGLYVWIRRIDRSTSVQYGSVFTLPGTCAATDEPGCVSADQARLRHTFNGAAGVATVEVVGLPLCPGEFFHVNLAAYGERAPNVSPDWLYRYDYNGVALSHRFPKASLRVELPPCRAEVRLELWNPYEIAGSPGSRSTGPFGQYFGSGTQCSSLPYVVGISDCDGAIIHLSNAAGANTPVQFAFVDVANNTMFRTLVLEPGESTVVKYAMPQVDLYVNGVLIKSVVWQRSQGCRAGPSTAPVPRRPPPGASSGVPSGADATMPEPSPAPPTGYTPPPRRIGSLAAAA